MIISFERIDNNNIKIDALLTYNIPKCEKSIYLCSEVLFRHILHHYILQSIQIYTPIKSNYYRTNVETNRLSNIVITFGPKTWQDIGLKAVCLSNIKIRTTFRPRHY